MQKFNPHISYYLSVKDVTSNTGIYLLTILDHIKTGYYKEYVEYLRTLPEDEYTQKKKNLNLVTFSGTFTKRNAKGLDTYSGLIVLDIDKLNTAALTAAKAAIIADDITHACFVSPSGNGLKVLIRTKTPPEKHLELYLALEHYFNVQYKIKIDKSGKDICRPCFVSYDADLYHNPDSFEIDYHFIKRNTPKKETPNPKKTQPQKEFNVQDKIHEIVSKTVQPQPGTYNTYINQYAMQANRYGLSESECADAICHYCGFTAPDKDDKATIRSVYTTFAAEHNSYSKPNQPRTYTPPAIEHSGSIKDDVKFWYIVGKIDKDTGEVMVNRQTGEPIGEYRFSYDDAITFLENNGFYKYRAGDGYQFIHVDKINNQVELVNELKIKEFMIDYLKSTDSIEFKRVREMFRRGAKNYCSTNILEGLEYYTPELRRDTADTAFVYFQNTYVEINKNGIFPKKYTAQKGFIWKKQLIQENYTDVDYTDSDVNKFIWYSCTGRKGAIADRSPEEWEKYNSVCTTIGYILHRYKSPVLTKAVIAVDKKLRRGAENNGRSGKSLFIKLISKMLNVVTIDGRNFGFDKDFNFQKVNIDTSLINFDDVKPNFDFTRLFSMITEEFSFEKKRIDLITIPFSDAPKFFISSNSTLKGDGESSIARQQIIEFSTYFNATHTPAIEFGRMFFHDWDTAEWQKYYCFMLHCIKMYLESGLIAFPLENYALNKLIDTAGEEFIDYMDEAIKANMQHGHVRFDSKVIYDKYIELTAPKYPIKKNTYSKWVRMWCELNGLDLNAHKNGERDRSSGVDYWTFTDKGTTAPTEPTNIEQTFTEPGEEIF